MKRLGDIMAGILVLSVVVNGWLGFSLHRSSQILQMQTVTFESFKSLLRAAVNATDAAKNDEPGATALKSDTDLANMDLQRAAGTIWGLRTDFAKKGMDIYPIFVALMESQNYSPYDSYFTTNETRKLIDKNSKTLHDIYSTLAPTSFSDSGLSELRQAIESFYGKYSGYPSYSKLQ